VKADVAVRGDAGSLYLLLNRRLPADDRAIEVHGDRSTLDTWLARTIF
jgi:predicted lipid carrier protein YhbT